MGYHHLAFASRDMQATHHFYADVLGFELVKAVAAPTDRPGGWAKHLFYAIGDHDGSENAGALIAFWELHDERMTDNDTAISTGLGFEAWVNHVAFAADDLDDIARRRTQWLEAGVDVMEIDHGFCTSIYTMDPNGILVEFCTDTAPYTQADKDRAEQILRSDDPGLESPPTPVFHSAAEHRSTASPPVTAAAGTPTT
ncbi:VOC family protein [Acidimicrobiia bacterium EGI L10123]|uniref:VOC family protein n=1 Tax=Salinilacustrithrix flava TaxID=2957203 RepID=UPI003D7C295D|nr:VOC family protein [Acidimicrobiia bacterium EGI L10123]